MADDRYERGVAKLKEIDHAGEARLIDGLRDIAPDLGRYAIEFGFGDIYQRPGLDLQQRQIAAIAALCALGTAPAQLRTHICGALRVGCTKDEVVEVIMQTAIFAGFPAALNGMTVARDAFAEWDRLSAK
jgi:4-carboxymuconolactone decarboxylase